MTHCHHCIISHRMEVCIMKIGRLPPRIKTPVCDVTVSVQPNLRNAKLDIISG